MSERTQNPKLSSRFEEALGYAARAHWTQIRKTGPNDETGATDEPVVVEEIPYLSHLLAVAGLVLENGGGEDEAIAALLHDVVEDQGGPVRREDVRWRFGDEVVRIVDACSDSDGDPKPPWRERKERSLAHLAEETDEKIRRVSVCDKLHNVRTLITDYRVHGDALWQRFNGKRDGTLWYYRALADEFVARGPARPAAELARAVAELEDAARAARGD